MLLLSSRPVLRDSSRPDFPAIPARRPTFGRSLLDPYKQQLLGWWNAGIRESSILMALIKPAGYEGSLRTLQRYTSGLCQAQGILSPKVKVTQPLPKVVDSQSPPFTPRQAAYLVTLKPENRQAEDTDLLEQLVKQHSDLTLLVALADEFLKLVRKRQANALDDWLLKFDDYAAVKASMCTEWSNGPVEGLNNKLKMLKRQMYGRASLDLLEKWLIMPTTS